MAKVCGTAELAKRWGTSTRMVQRYVTHHGLPVQSRSGKILQFDPAKADAWHRGFVTTNPGHGGLRSRHRGDGEKAAAPSGNRAIADQFDLDLRRERVRKAKMENDLAEGRLVDAELVLRNWSTQLAEVRQQVESMPSRLAPKLAAKCWPDDGALMAVKRKLAERGVVDEEIVALMRPLEKPGHIEQDFRKIVTDHARATLRSVTEQPPPKGSA